MPILLPPVSARSPKVESMFERSTFDRLFVEYVNDFPVSDVPPLELLNLWPSPFQTRPSVQVDPLKGLPVFGGRDQMEIRDR